MPQTQVTIKSRDATGAESPVRSAWVYWRQGGNVTRLFTDGGGRLFGFTAGGDPTHPWDYRARFVATVGAQVAVYFSRGAEPIPDALLTAHAAAFVTVTVPQPPAGAQARRAPVRAAAANALVVRPTAIIVLPDILLTLTKPAELSFWPLLWELPTDAYLTNGLNQGAALWRALPPDAQGQVRHTLTVTENGPSPAPAAAVRPRERGLKLAGSIDARATGVKIQVLDRSGNPVQLRQGIATGGAAVQEIDGTLGAAAGDTKNFEAAIFFVDAVNTFGLVQIVVRSVGMAPPIIAAFTTYLCGCQTALVDDHTQNANGQTRGTVLNESDQTIIVDFLASPQATSNAVRAQARARRMLAYQFANHDRPLNPTQPGGAANPVIVRPQMPLWMAEFQMVGVTLAAFKELLGHRYFKENLDLIDPFTPEILQLALQWQLTLAWDGPDSNTGVVGQRPSQAYRYNLPLTGSQAVKIHFRNNGRFTDANVHDVALGNGGELPGAFDPAPTAIPFPVANRRLPQVVVRGQRRTWGRHAGAVQKDALVVEFQPSVVDGASQEILRGGDGVLELQSVSIDGQRIDGGLVPAAGGQGLARPAAADPDVRLPPFRVRGLNLQNQNQVTAIINALVLEHFNAHQGEGRIDLLTLACWQETVRRIVVHEAGINQFEQRASTRRVSRFRGTSFGLELDMPIFGPPHGYGLGQHDLPPVTDDGAWSFVENLKGTVRLIMDGKARGAFTTISAHMPALANQRIRAVYQREIVRRYNGGREFRWNGAAWEIRPSIRQWEDNADHSKGANRNLNYPNAILGTRVVYFQGAGAATTFPWPITFRAADFGPET